MQETSNKQTRRPNTKVFDLEDRTLQFAREVRDFVYDLPKTMSNQEDTRQLVRASGSIGANYIEVNDALGKKDFIMRIKIARKEAKESRYWLELIDTDDNTPIAETKAKLIQESTELVMILSKIASNAI